MNKKTTFITIIFLVFVIIIVYWGITKTFYQQDEWLGYGLYLSKGAGIILQSTGGFWGIMFGQGRILTNLLYFLFYKYSPLNVFPIAIFAIVLHTINTLIVFFLAKELFKRILPAFLGSLFFAVSSVSQNAIVWPAASINTLPSTTLILIAIYSLFKYLDESKKRWLVLSFGLIYLSLFFKETGIFLFLLFPLFALYYKKQNIQTFLKTYWYFLVAVLSIVVFRIWGFKSDFNQVALFLTGSSKYFFDSLVVRSILYPLTSFSLSIVPPDYFLNFARYITNVYYPFISEAQFILVSQTVVLDLLTTVLSVIIALILLSLFKITDSGTRKSVIFWLVFLLASFLPYIIISKNYSYLESRYYYLASIAWGIIFAWMADLVVEKIKLRYVKVVFLIIFILFLYTHARVVVKGTRKLVGESRTRINILNQILEIKPKLDGKKNIFYVIGDTDYYVSGNKVPFQQGFGYTLLALYFPKSEYPSDFLGNIDLFEIGKQGYYEISDYGFGYFSDKKELKSFLKRQNISITGLYYDSETKTISLLSPFFLMH